ncbi:MAG TPA: PepSY domain-containing protein [Pseudobdellovibrionaceae bacterium]|nr:PepSY domain-containing protein [Pseudobdellovibrionaceae bacterium]
MRPMTILTILPLFLSAPAFAKKNCTDEPKTKWMTVEAFKQQVTEQGYQIRKFKQPGTCYEIYGTDKDGNDVEIYFNPVNGQITKKK